MKVLRKCPDEPTVVVDVENSYKALQEEVGGDIQGIYPFSSPYSIICNENGKIEGLQPNLAMVNEAEIIDIIVGTIIFVRLEGDGYVDLTDDDVKIINSMIDYEGRLCICDKHVIPTIECR